MHEPSDGLQALVELPDEVLRIVVRVGQVERRVEEVRAELKLRGLESLDHRGGDATPDGPPVCGEIHEPLRRLLDGLRLDNALDHGDEGLESLSFCAVILVIRREQLADALHEVSSTELVDDLLTVHEPCGSWDVLIPIGNDRTERVPDGLELPEVHDPFDPTFLLGEVVVREVAGPVIHPDEPALLVHPHDLVLGELRSVYSFDGRVVYLHHLPVDGEDTGPKRTESLGDLPRARERCADAVDDVHDRILRSLVSTREDAQGCAFEALPRDLLHEAIS